LVGGGWSCYCEGGDSSCWEHRRGAEVEEGRREGGRRERGGAHPRRGESSTGAREGEFRGPGFELV